MGTYSKFLKSTIIGNCANYCAQVKCANTLIGVVKMSNNTQKLIIKQIAETTGKSSAEIGETLKSIFERCNMVFEIVYYLSKEVGINIFDQNCFRNTDEVMRDFASKWETLSKEKQKEISVKISKRYDLSDFLALINLYK